MDQDLITKKIHKAYRTLLARDIHLFHANANERSFTHKLAEYLQKEFPEWNVDCEYNKNLNDSKRIPVWQERRDELVKILEKEISEKKRDMIQKILDGGISVYPDIIIHHRETSDNLVIIEAKKDNFSGIDYDDHKLIKYKEALGYKHAFKITFSIEKDKLKDFEIEHYIQEI